MTRRRRFLMGMGAAAGAYLLLALLFYTPPGLALVARLVAPNRAARCGSPALAAYSPITLTAARVKSPTIRAWLTADDVRLDWSALPALFQYIVIDVCATHRGAAQSFRCCHKPETERGPVIDIARLLVPRELANRWRAGPSRCRRRAHLHYASLRDLCGAHHHRPPPGGTDLTAGGIARNAARGQATVREERRRNPWSKLLDLPGPRLINIAASAHGDATANAVAFTASAGALKRKAGAPSNCVRPRRSGFHRRLRRHIGAQRGHGLAVRADGQKAISTAPSTRPGSTRISISHRRVSNGIAATGAGARQAPTATPM